MDIVIYLTMGGLEPILVTEVDMTPKEALEIVSSAQETNTVPNLRGADLRWANLGGADLPAPSIVLTANWGRCSDKTTIALMRLDASAHPEGGKAFTLWASGGRCPYSRCRVQRVANFAENASLWSAGRPPTLYKAMCMVLDEHCPGWNN